MTEDSSFVDDPFGYLLALVRAVLPGSLASARLRFVVPVLACLLAVPLVYLARLGYRRFVVGRPVLHGRDDGFKRFLVSSCPILSESYAPIFWAWHCHANTVFRAMCQRTVPLNYERCAECVAVLLLYPLPLTFLSPPHPFLFFFYILISSSLELSLADIYYLFLMEVTWH